MFGKVVRFTQGGVTLEAGSPPVGGGSDTDFEVTAAPAGGWSWFGDPRGAYYNGKTYFGYINASGDVCVRSYHHTGGTVSAETVLHASYEVDDHDNPAIYIRPSDHKIICYYSKHVGATLDYRISSSAESIASFAAEASVTGPESVTYPSPLYTSNSTRLFLFYRQHAGGVASWRYRISTDGGATFGNETQLVNFAYAKVVSDGVDRVDVVTSGHPDPSLDNAKQIYHLYREANAWHKSDGATITGTPPFVASKLTTVYDGGSKNVWIWDIAYKGDGNPVIAFVVFESSTDHRYWYADWNGSTWSTWAVASGGTYIPTEVVPGQSIQAYYSGGIVLDHADPTIVYYSRQAASGQWEMYRAVTADAGATWTETAITSDSLVKHVRPFVVRDHASDLAAIWSSGTYASYVNYSVGISGVAE